MKKTGWVRGLTLVLALMLLATAVGALSYDWSGDGKTDVWDLQLGINENKTASERAAALKEALDGADELHPNAKGEYEIWSSLGLYKMAEIIENNKEKNTTFRLMRDVDMQGAIWQATESFNGILEADGHVISNVNVVGEIVLSGTTYGTGFFGKIGQDGAVRNLKLENVNVILDNNAKSSFVGLLTSSLTGEITNCTTVGTVIDPRTVLSATTYIGTLTGRVENVSSYTVPGISVTDESILMTAESAEITKISQKSQKVLCKMGMEFGTLSYPEGTESAKQYKRQLGTAGWAPNYDAFKAYNWQDISGACNVTGGTGKVYNLEDPILTARRQAAVDKMYEICTVEWTPSKDMTIYYYKVGTGENAGKLAYSSKTWKAGKTYRGMPYNHGSGSLERFEAWMSGTDSQGRLVTKTSLPTTAYYYTHGVTTKDANGNTQLTGVRKALSGYTDATFQTPLTFTDPDTGKTYDLLPGFTVSDQPLAVGESVASADHAGWCRYLGNDCSQAIMWAWREVVSSDVKNGGTVISGVTQMCPTPTNQTRYGVTPVGGIVPSTFSVATIDAMYSKDTFMNAYAQASRGDALIDDQTAGAHSRMIAYDPICIRNYRGVIHETNSYLITHEQGGSSKNSYTTCNWDRVLTFKALADDDTHKNNNADGTGVNCKHYFPTSINAFHNVDNKAVTSTVSYKNGVVKSNFCILSLTVDGKEVFPSISQHSTTNSTTRVGDGYRDAHVQETVSNFFGDVTGKTITVRLSNGDIYTINADSGTVTKQ